MIGVFPLRNPSPFAFPGTAPAVDPTHPACRKFLRFSGVAQGANFRRIDKALKGTITNTITGGIDGSIGPYIRNSGTIGKATFAGNSTVAPTSCTIGAIFSFTTTGSVRIIFDMTGAGGAAVPMLWVSNADNNLHLGSNGGTKEFNSGLGLVANTPYFGVASYNINGSGNINFAVTNLQTGQVRTAAIAHTFAATASNGTYCVGGDGAGDTNEIAIATCMYSTAGLSPGEVRAWAQDPWSFWYPRKPDLGTMIAVQSSGGNTFSDSVSEAGSASDVESVIATFAASDAEAVTATEADSVTAVFASSDTEAGTAADADSASAVFAATDTEAATASDADGGGYTVGQSESGSAADTENAAAVYPVSVSEAGTAAETESAVAVFAASDTEGASASDSESTGFSDGTTETASATDAESASVVFASDVAEAGVATDAPSAAAVYPVADAEAASASDADAETAVFVASDAEAATSGDSSDAAFGSQTYNVDVAEAGNASDSSDASAPDVIYDTHDGGSSKYHKYWTGLKKKEDDKRREREALEREAAKQPKTVKPDPAPAALASRPIPVAPVDTARIAELERQIRAAEAQRQREEEEILFLIDQEEKELLRTFLALAQALEDET